MNPVRANSRERLRAALEDVCGKPAADSIELQLAQDGSVLGAAFLAVAAARWEAEHGSIGGGRAS
jgi:hexokinase